MQEIIANIDEICQNLLTWPDPGVRHVMSQNYSL